MEGAKKRLFCWLALAVLFFGFKTPALAERARFDSKADQWGVGLYLGNPTALTVKYWVNTTNAWDTELGGYWNYGGAGAINANVSYLWHRYYIFGKRDNLGYNLPIYYGIGGAFSAWNGGMGAGVRGVLGITYLFAQPFDVFAEIAPVVGVIPGFGIGYNAGIGARVYLSAL